MLEINEQTKDTDLKLIRSEIMANANSGFDVLMYHNTETGEEIVLSKGILVGNLNGKFFGCSCYRPMGKLFFKESRDLNDKNPHNYQPMSFSRVHEFLDDLDARLATVDNSYYMRLQMHTIRERYDTECKTKENKRGYEAQKKLNEAEAAKQRRLENEERTRQRKAAREAERLKRKKIEETRKRVNADAAKASAERKAREEQRRIAAIESKKKEIEMQQKQEEERIATLMMNTFRKHKTLPPVFEYDKNGNKCFYLKINNKVIHLVMHPQKPRCQILTETTSSFLTPHDLMDVFENIETHLNSQGKIESVLEQLPSFYAQCSQIEKIKNDPNSKLVSPMSVCCENKDAPAFYKKICTRLMTPSAYPYNVPTSQHDR
ncbi:MAG: hypothetical protein IKV03_01935 [Alphaproteobacteria bacterium]|nr:hypothetical protein [Alphaproteobacteria bacterium]